MKQPNIVYVFGDQWRQQAFGYAGDTNVLTPHIDRLANESVSFDNAISSCPVCCPARASLLTGQQPGTHGVFVNDVQLCPQGLTLAELFKEAGYETGYIGKWHLDGHGRSAFIPPERRLGFDYWKVLECTHDYNHSAYYAGESGEKRFWEGYDAIAQTNDAIDYIQNAAKKDKPFLLMLSWGGPHNPYETAPEKYKSLYQNTEIDFRVNVPQHMHDQVREQLKGYYAHCTALDDCIADLQAAIRLAGIEEDTIFIFSSDHGDMLGSQGSFRKQKPWEESLRIPFLLKYPRLLGSSSVKLQKTFDLMDVLPTLLDLCQMDIPHYVEGVNHGPLLRSHENDGNDFRLIYCLHPFGEWNAVTAGGKEYRGIWSSEYLYVRDLNGPWLLYDLRKDPYQQSNLLDSSENQELANRLEGVLEQMLHDSKDEFKPGQYYLDQWGYVVNEMGTVDFTM